MNKYSLDNTNENRFHPRFTVPLEARRPPKGDILLYPPLAGGWKTIFFLLLSIITCTMISCESSNTSSATATKKHPTSTPVPEKTPSKMVAEIFKSTIKYTDGSQEEIPNWEDDDVLVLILARHAEKKTDKDDPDLTAAGKNRAKKLAGITRNAGIDKQYHSGYKRTFQTILPSMNRGAPTALYKVNQLTGFIDGLLENERGKKCLIVGHSNTTPAIVNHLVDKKVYNNIPEDEYGWLYIISTSGKGQTEVIKVKY